MMFLRRILKRSRDSADAFDHALQFRHLIEEKTSRILSTGAPDLKFENAVAFKSPESDSAAGVFGRGQQEIVDHAILFRRQADSVSVSSRKRRVPEHCIRDGILIIHDFISKEDCGRLVRYMDSQDTVPLEIANTDHFEQRGVVAQRHAGRVGEQIAIDGEEQMVLRIFEDVYRCRLAPFYGVTFEWYERPIMLRYGAGGTYGPHADSEASVDTGKWRRIMDRDYSVVLYLNAEYEGGEIEFIRQHYTLRPQTGMLVAFPSDHRYAHAALPVTAGRRYAVVSWAAISGSERIAIRPENSILLS